MHKPGTKYIFTKNKPVLGNAFESDEVKKYLQSLLKNLYDANELKRFLRIGYEEYFNEKIKELSNHFYVLEHGNDCDVNSATYNRVKRCIDGVIFTVGDEVIDKIDPKRRSLSIRRMYEDEHGLHVGLHVMSDGNGVTWRNLSNIEHDLPF